MCEQILERATLVVNRDMGQNKLQCSFTSFQNYSIMFTESAMTCTMLYLGLIASCHLLKVLKTSVDKLRSKLSNDVEKHMKVGPFLRFTHISQSEYKNSKQIVLKQYTNVAQTVYINTISEPTQDL